MSPLPPSVTQFAPLPAPVRRPKGPGDATRITVLVADDHPLVREALVRTLQDDGRFEVVAQGADGREAVRLAAEIHPKLVVLDVRMPGLDGLEAMRAILRRTPGIRVVLLSAFDDGAVMQAALAAGAAGYLTKDAEREAICDALARAGRGAIVVPSDALMAAGAPDAVLSRRQRNVLLLSASDWSDEMIAMLLGITAGEVGQCLRRVSFKLGAEGRGDAIEIARARGLVP